MIANGRNTENVCTEQSIYIRLAILTSRSLLLGLRRKLAKSSQVHDDAAVVTKQQRPILVTTTLKARV